MEHYTVLELKEIAKTHHVVGAYKMNKKELYNVLSEKKLLGKKEAIIQADTNEEFIKGLESLIPDEPTKGTKRHELWQQMQTLMSQLREPNRLIEPAKVHSKKSTSEKKEKAKVKTTSKKTESKKKEKSKTKTHSKKSTSEKKEKLDDLSSESLSRIAIRIKKDWKDISPYALDHLKAMQELSSINDAYGDNSGESVVRYFLANSGKWKGEIARQIKAELHRRLKKNHKKESIQTISRDEDKDEEEKEEESVIVNKHNKKVNTYFFSNDDDDDDEKVNKEKQHTNNKLSIEPLSEIAMRIEDDWNDITPAALEQLQAMGQLSSIKDTYVSDSGEAVVRYFLANSKKWKSKTAQRIKAELHRRLKELNIKLIHPSMVDKKDDQQVWLGVFWFLMLIIVLGFVWFITDLIISYVMFLDACEQLHSSSFQNLHRYDDRCITLEWQTSKPLALSSERKAQNAHLTCPKIIWTYWDNPDKVPQLVKMNWARWKQMFQGKYDVRILFQTTIGDYISEPYPEHYDMLGKAHQADWLRLMLLSKYGGIWIDSTVIINDIMVFDDLYHDINDRHVDYGGFYLEGKQTNPRFPVIENWFIMAPPSSPIIHAWCQEWSRAITMGLLSYRQYAENELRVDSQKLFYHPWDYYLTCHLALQTILQKQQQMGDSHSQESTMRVYRAEDSMFQLHVICQWVASFIGRLVTSDDAQKIPFTKIRSCDRDYIDLVALETVWNKN